MHNNNNNNNNNNVFIHSLIYGHLSLFPGFCTVDCASINTAVHVPFLMRVFIFTGYMASSEIAGSYGNCIFRFFVLFCFFFSFFNSIPGREMDRRFKMKRIYVCMYVCIWLTRVEV